MGETTIDQISEDREGNIILLLRQVERWDNPETLLEFQIRLNGYVDVVAQGALYEKYPDMRGRPVRIRLLCYDLPPQQVKLKLDQVNHELQQRGMGLEILQIKVETPQKMRAKDRLRSLFRRLVGGGQDRLS
jgi:hypothetical protein